MAQDPETSKLIKRMQRGEDEAAASRRRTLAKAFARALPNLDGGEMYELDGRTGREMSDYTPGPWTVEDYGDDETPVLVVHKDTESRVCFMATPGSNGDPAIIAADARLIAAAPDLLDAIDQAIDDFGDGHCVCENTKQKMRAAMAKATGADTL